MTDDFDDFSRCPGEEMNSSSGGELEDFEEP